MNELSLGTLHSVRLSLCRDDQSRFIVSKNNISRSFKFVKIAGEAAIAGQSLHPEFSRFMMFYSQHTFCKYLRSLDLAPRVREGREVGDYIENLFCEELGFFVRDVAVDEAKSHLAGENSLLVRPSYAQADTFFVSKRFAKEIRHFCYQVTMGKPQGSELQFVIAGPAILQHLEKNLHFTSSLDFKHYLEMQNRREGLSKEQEETALFADQLMLAYHRMEHEKRYLLRRSLSNPTKLWLVKFTESHSEIRGFRILKNHEKGACSDCIIVGQAGSNPADKVTFYSASSFLNYLAAHYHVSPYFT